MMDSITNEGSSGIWTGHSRWNVVPLPMRQTRVGQFFHSVLPPALSYRARGALPAVDHSVWSFLIPHIWIKQAMVSPLLLSLAHSSFCYHFPGSPKPSSSKTSAKQSIDLALNWFSPRRQFSRSISRRALRSVCFFNPGEKSKEDLQEKVLFLSSKLLP